MPRTGADNERETFEEETGYPCDELLPLDLGQARGGGGGGGRSGRRTRRLAVRGSEEEPVHGRGKGGVRLLLVVRATRGWKLRASEGGCFGFGPVLQMDYESALFEAQPFQIDWDVSDGRAVELVLRDIS